MEILVMKHAKQIHNSQTQKIEVYQQMIGRQYVI